MYRGGAGRGGARGAARLLFGQERGGRQCPRRGSHRAGERGRAAGLRPPGSSGGPGRPGRGRGTPGVPGWGAPGPGGLRRAELGSRRVRGWEEPGVRAGRPGSVVPPPPVVRGRAPRRRRSRTLPVSPARPAWGRGERGGCRRPSPGLRGSGRAGPRGRLSGCPGSPPGAAGASSQVATRDPAPLYEAATASDSAPAPAPPGAAAQRARPWHAARPGGPGALAQSVAARCRGRRAVSHAGQAAPEAAGCRWAAPRLRPRLGSPLPGCWGAGGV